MNPLLIGTAARYFLEVARTGSLTRASEQLHVAPSAVSRQIAKLEDRLGLALFERKGRGMQLSLAGERLATHVRGLMLDDQRVVDEMLGAPRKAPPTLRIACTEGFAGGFMAEVLAAFRRRHPQCVLHVIAASPEGVSRQLLRGDVDVGLKFSVALENGLRIVHQQAAPIMLMVAPTHPLAGRKRVTLAELAKHPVGMPSSGTTVRQLLDLVLSLEGVELQAAYVAGYSTLESLAERGDAAVFSSMLAASLLLASGRLCAVPVSEFRLRQRNIQVLTSEKTAAQGDLQDLLDGLGEALARYA
jgi:DNA-binding transcriptional LysR family regulator